MKSLLLLSSYYAPETGAAAKRLSAMTRHLRSQGWQITVVTLLPHHPANLIYEGFDESTPVVEIQDGIKIVRYRPWLVPSTSLAKRLLAELVFCWHALLYALLHRHDLVFGSSPSMFLGITALLAGRLNKMKVVWEVRDLTWLYPRSAGKRTFGLDMVLEKLMLFVAKHVDALITVSPGFLKYFSRNHKAFVLPNGVTPELLARLEPNTQVALFQGSRPKVLYAGLLGFIQQLDILIESAKLLPDIDFTLIGDGPEKAALMQKVSSLGLSNVTFKAYMDAEALKKAYREHDIFVSHIRRDDIHVWTQPSKLWEYMAAGRPVVHAGEGEIAAIIQDNKLGLCPLPGDPVALAKALRKLVDHPDEARGFAERGRTFVEQHRNRAELLKKLTGFLSDLT